MTSTPESFQLEIGPEEAGLRLDRALARSLEAAFAAGETPRLSRSRLKALLETGRIVALDGSGVSLDPTRAARAGERFRVDPVATEPALSPEPLPLDIVYEDPHLLVINKAPGMLVHPAHARHAGTLAHALLAHCGASLSGVGHPLRPGIVHRLDVGTGGLLVAARREAARLSLAEQFAAHDIEREYLAVVWGSPSRADAALANRPGVSFGPRGWIRIQAPIGPDPRRPARRAVSSRGGKRAVTYARVETRPEPGAPSAATLLRCRLETGRTHQIRVHLSWIGHPLVGDRAYGRAPTLSASVHDEELRAILGAFPRPALHASRLGFRHPETGESMRFEAPPHEDFAQLARALGASLPLARVGGPTSAMM